MAEKKKKGGLPECLNRQPWKIISGGQTGVDRAALVAAMSWSMGVGGWIPKGRKAEDGVVPENFYGLRECSGGYRDRTRANVNDVNATLILSDRFPLPGGTAYTADFAANMGRPFKIVDLDMDDVDVQIREWMFSLECTDGLSKETIVLNVVGLKESVSPGIFKKAKDVLHRVFAQFRNGTGGDVYAIDDDGSLTAWVDAEFAEELFSYRRGCRLMFCWLCASRVSATPIVELPMQ